jgi:flavin reductase (DIM6/NTAB) family NADH-FMN oxidoreductase RutF
MIDSVGFRAVLGRFASGVTVVTTVDEHGNDHGITVSAFCSVSLSPPLIQICIDHTSDAHGALIKCQVFAVNILAEDQEHLARKFADVNPKERFKGAGYERGSSGAVILDGALAHIECKHVAAHDSGDHTIFIGEVQNATTTEKRPLLYYRGGYAKLEH